MQSSFSPSDVDLIVWHKCNICKKPILYSKMYYVCNVSTCNRNRTSLRFCSVSCWDAHLPEVRHRESWAEERRAPTRENWLKQLAEEAEPRTRAKKGEPPVESVKAEKSSGHETEQTVKTPVVIRRKSN